MVTLVLENKTGLTQGHVRDAICKRLQGCPAFIDNSIVVSDPASHDENSVIITLGGENTFTASDLTIGARITSFIAESVDTSRMLDSIENKLSGMTEENRADVIKDVMYNIQWYIGELHDADERKELNRTIERGDKSFKKKF